MDKIGFTDLCDSVTDTAGRAFDSVCTAFDSTRSAAKELSDICTEFKEEMVDACKNEGVEVLKAAPGAIIEAKDLAAPIVAPTPGNIAKAAYRVYKISKD